VVADLEEFRMGADQLEDRLALGRRPHRAGREERRADPVED
jgi:hypothetical protein